MGSAGRAKTAQRQAVGLGLIGQQPLSLRDKLCGDLGGLVAFGSRRLRGQGCHTRRLRIGIVNVAAQTCRAKTTTKRCSLTGSTNTSTPGIFTCRSLIARAHSSLPMRPVRIANQTGLIERAKVAACGHVVRAQLETNARRFELPRPMTYLIGS